MQALHEWLTAGSLFGGWFSAEWFAESVSNAWVRLAIDSAAKATVLLLLALLATTLWRNSSAALRHRVWCLTFAGLVILPGLSAALPAWRLPILPAPASDPAPVIAPVAPALEQPSAEPIAERFTEARPVEQMRPAAFDLGPRPETAPAPLPTLEPAPDVASLPPSPPVPTAIDLSTVWLFGFAIALLPLAVGVVRNALVRMRARPFSDAGWAGLLDELRALLTLRRRVKLLETDAAVMPMTWGLVCPVVLLPRQARQWAERLRRFVLLHELAHVKRGDVGFQMLARVACALYWFHPLAWLALRRLRIERELACDDCVLAAGERPSDYAAELLRVAHDYRPPRLAAAVAMAQRGSLEHRIRALLDRARSHLPMSARSARVLLVLAAAIVTAVAMVRPGPRAVGDEESAETAAEKTSSSPDGAADQHRVHGRVVDENGQPIAGARVCVVRADTEVSTWVATGRLLADARTDASGRFDLQHLNDTPHFTTRERFIYQTTLYVLAFAEGRALDWVVSEPGDRPELVLHLLPDSVAIEGQVVDLEGRPVSGVRVDVNQVTEAKGDVDRWVAAARRNPKSLGEDWDITRPQPGEERPTVAHFPGGKELKVGLPNLLPAAVSDAAGRFRLSGLGADRLTRLEASGPAIAKTWVEVLTRVMPELPYPTTDPRFRVGTCFGARFVLTVEPDQPIRGVVTDAESGSPLAGVEVRLNQYGGSLLMVEGFLATVTDKQGRYTLSGVPKPIHPERRTRLRVVPAAGQPYLRTETKVGKADGLAPVRADVELKRTARLRGRVSDAVTGRPLRGLVGCYPLFSNPAVADYPNFDPVSGGDDDMYAVGDDGAYEIPAVPGRGIVVFIAADEGRYPYADGAANLAGLQTTDKKRLSVYQFPAADLATALREIVVPSEGADATCDIEVPPLPVAKLRLVDEAGEPVIGALARGLTPVRSFGQIVNKWPSQPLSSDVAEVVGVNDQRERTLLFLHRGRQIAAALRIGDGPLPKQVVLRPCASIVGRLVDGAGQPPRDAWLQTYVAQKFLGEGSGWLRDHIEMQHELPGEFDQGRFRFDSVPPGVEYQIMAESPSMESPLRKTTAPLQPGETLDLGDLALTPDDISAEALGGNRFESFTTANNAQTEADATAAWTANAEPRDSVPVTGRVVDEEDRPIAGARVRLIQSWDSGDSSIAPIVEWSGDTRSDGEGRFSLDAAPFADPPSAAAKRLAATHDFRPERCAVATADGYGFVFEHLPTSDDGAASERNVVLKLPRDSAPIEGRVLDLEGRPVRAARVTLRQLILLEKEKLDDWLSGLPEGIAQNGPYEIPWGCALMSFDNFWNPFPAQLTDDDGRFTFTGVGADRVAHLQIEAPTLASTWTVVVTRPMKAVRLPSGRRQFRAQMCFGSKFDIAVEPSRPIRGAIADAETGSPIAGAEVRLNLSGQEGFLSTVSDAAGRYELRDAGRPAPGEKDELSILPASGQPYFRTEVEVPQAAGPDPVVCDVRLGRAVLLRGRVIDRRTKQPVAGAVRYYPWLSNAAARAFPNFEPGVHKLGYDDRYATDGDGNFVLPALPGRGLLTVVAEHGERYPLGEGSETIADLWQPDGHYTNVYHISRGELGLDQDNAVRSVEIPAGARECTLDVQLAPLPVIRLELVDDGGQPLTGVETQGLRPSNPFSQHGGSRWDDPAPTAAVELIGPAAGEWRDVLFRHRDRRLGTVVRFTHDDVGASPRKVQLQPFATIAGRLVDADGKPVAGALISAWAKPGDDVNGPGIHPRQFHLPLSNGTTTDANGRFQLASVLPGTRWEVTAYVEHGDTKWRKLTAPITAGETIDLGDVPPQPPVDKHAADESASAAKSPSATDGTAKNAASANEKDQSPAADEKATAEPTTTVLRGRVLGPKGEPAVGAGLYWPQLKPSQPPAAGSVQYVKRGETDAEGGFELSLTAADVPTSAHMMRLIAQLPGFGLDWIDFEPAKAPKEITLRLVEDHPIRGGVIDTEGRPLADVPVVVTAVLASTSGSLDDFLTLWQRDQRTPVRRAGQFSSPKLDRRLHLPPRSLLAAITDRQGRFELLGVGSERVATLNIAPPGSVSADVTVVNRAGFDADKDNAVAAGAAGQMRRAGMAWRLSGPEFDHVAEAELVVRGQVFTQPDHAQVVGAMVGASGAGGLPISQRTDAAGRYELHGIPRSQKSWLNVRPPRGGELLPRTIELAAAAGETTVEINVELKRGVIVEGRVFDRATSQGVRSGVRYVRLPGNISINPSGNDGATSRYGTESTDAEGRFRLIVPSGTGVVIAQARGNGPRIDGHEINPYRQANFTAEEQERVPISEDGDDRRFTAADNSLESVNLANAVKLIDAPPDGGPVVCDLSVDSGKTLEISIEDDQGQPLADAWIAGMADSGSITFKIAAPKATIYGLGADRPRRVCILHPGRRLATSLTLTGDEPGPVVARLAASAAIVGRALDEDGSPLAGAIVQLTYDRRSASELDRFARADGPVVKTDDNGHFRVENVLPGERFLLGFKQEDYYFVAKLTDEQRELKAGQVLDVGDLSPKPLKADRGAGDSTSAAKPPTADATATKKLTASEGKTHAEPASVVLRGRVLGPNGEPASGAGLYWRDVKSPRPRTAGDIRFVKRAATDGAGRFELSIAPGDLPPASFDMMLVAHQPGFGLDWIKIAPADSKEITLRLVEDRPIHGRVIDTEGRPLVGVPVSVNDVMAPNSGKLDEFLAAWLRDWDRSWPKLDRKLYAPLDSIVGTVTDQQGRFELSGIGLERVATVEISPPGYASSEIKVVHRADFDAAKFNQAALARSAPERRRPSMTPRLAGPEFEHIAEAEFVVQGTVFLEPNRTPLVGVEVVAGGGWAPAVSSLTDAAGRYALHGLPRGEVELVSFQPPVGSDLLSRMMSVTSMPGETAVDLNVELKRGIVVEGRVFDKVTSRGVKGGVRFVPLPGNAFVDQPGYDGYKHSRVSESTDAEGRFRVVVPPGAGVMIVQVYGSKRVGKQQIKPYRQANFTAAERERVAVMEDDEDRRFTAADQSLEFLSNENAVKVIDLPPGSDSFVCDLPVDPGKTVEMEIQDDQGRPLSDVAIAGITDGWPHVLKIAEPHTTIFALGADRPRRVCILHPARHLAASLTLTGDESGPVTARLAASASIVGRALDASGAPIAGAVVQINYARRCASEIDRFVGLEQPAVTTDDDGRFRVENVLPGERFALDFRQADHYFRANLTEDQRELKAGQVLDVGEASVKQIR